jgi:hypothetical protein
MEPLFNPQVGCVGDADTERGDEGFSVTLAVPEQPLTV